MRTRVLTLALLGCLTGAARADGFDFEGPRGNSLPSVTAPSVTAPTGSAAPSVTAPTGSAAPSVTAPATPAIPEAAAPPTHRVTRGETLWAISRRYGVSVAAIRTANGLETDRLEVDQVLVVPGSEPPTSPAPAAANPLPAWVAVRLPDGRTGWAPSSGVIVEPPAPLPPDRAVEIARRMTGTPYVWGGQTPNGADCSGFVQEVYRLCGHKLPRLADEQYAVTFKVEEAQPGDLVFFTTYLPGPSHVGIYVGERRFIHASSSGGVTESGLDENYYQTRYLGARRISPP